MTLEFEQREVTRRGSLAARRLNNGVERALELTRYAMILAVLILIVSALGSIVYAFFLLFHAGKAVENSPYPAKRNLTILVFEADVLLVAATLFIAAVGFYELFVRDRDQPAARRWLPNWLVMNDLNDLKGRVISMLVLISLVSFTDVVVNFVGGTQILYVGSGVALVTVASTIYLRFGAGNHH